MHDLNDFDDYVEMARSLLGGFENSGDLWEANECINTALLMKPADASAWILKSQIMSSLEDDLSALASAEMAVQNAPHSAEALYVRAAVLSDMEQHAEALSAIDLAFRQLGNGDEWLLEDLYYEKAAILDSLERHDEALATFETGLRRCPDSALLRSGLEPLRRDRMRSAFTVIDGGLG